MQLGKTNFKIASVSIFPHHFLYLIGCFKRSVVPDLSAHRLARHFIFMQEILFPCPLSKI